MILPFDEFKWAKKSERNTKIEKQRWRNSNKTYTLEPNPKL